MPPPPSRAVPSSPRRPSPRLPGGRRAPSPNPSHRLEELRRSLSSSAVDDLLLNYYGTGEDELKAKAGNSKHGRRGCNSDDLDELFKENSEKEIKICKIVECIENEAKKLDAREDVLL